jgi:BMFP domain-containing protein YqiC
LPDQHVEAEVMSGKDIRSLETSLEALWEKARRVSEALVQTREKNGDLRKRMEDLEAVEQRLMQELADKEREVERLRQEVLRAQSNGSNILTKEEKEALKARIKDLITKISSHL